MSHTQDNNPKAYPNALRRESRFKYLMRYTIFALVALCLVAAGIYIMLDFDEPSEEVAPKQSIAEQNVEPRGVEAVDMGLSVEWASQNVGATSPTDGGDYYAWGDIRPSERYVWRSSTCYNQPIATIDVAMDVATQLGEGWRMPTREEFQELVDECEWQESERDGVYGFEVIAPNDNRIFLPAAGYRYDTLNYHRGVEGVYWSASSALDADNKRATALRINNHEQVVDDYYRYYGASIRAVKEHTMSHNIE